ncbi:MAG: hypothetical protein ACYCWB_14530 [Thiobacillus sp.]
MKKLICLAVLSLAISSAGAADVAAEGLHAICAQSGKVNKVLLELARAGENPTQHVLENVSERAQSDTMRTMLMMAQDTWENRHTYTPAKAYSAGYAICMRIYTED